MNRSLCFLGVLSIHEFRVIKASLMLSFDLRKLIDEYEARTGVRMSYQELANLTGISTDTLKSLAARQNYNATLHLIEKISSALGANPIKYFSWNPDEFQDGNGTKE
jgi:DNA-binding Xre family transcriptional regulator